MPEEGRSIPNEGEARAEARDRGLTFGHPSAYSFHRWAERRGLGDAAIRLIALAGNPTSATPLGAVVQFLQGVAVQQQLEDWADDVQGLTPLLHVAAAWRTAASTERFLPKIDPALRVDRVFRGQLESSQLAALCASRLPPGRQTQWAWIDSIRCWVFSVAVRYLDRGIQQDRHVSIFARHLRAALDDSNRDVLLDWFSKHARPVDRLDDVRAAFLHAHAREPAPADLATAARAIAREHPAPILNAAVLPLVPLHRAEIEASLLDVADAIVVESSDDEDTLFRPLPEDLESSPSAQAARARSILLDSVEDLQWLPHQWTVLREDERSSLVGAIGRWVASDDPTTRLCASVSALAMLTGNSVATALRIPLSADQTNDWCFLPDRAALRRKPPRRASGWRATEGSRSWVASRADHWELRLAPSVVRPIQRSVDSKAATLHDVWTRVTSESIENVFNSLCRSTPGLERISSGMLKRGLRQSVFEITNDHALTRLIFSSERSGLPGACAYPAYSGAQIQHVWNSLPVAPWLVDVKTGDSTNCAGSELDPIDEMLRDSIVKLRSTIEATATEGRWVDHHNALTLYVVLALLSATGARPVSSPFENPASIDWRAGFAVIDDKDAGTGGRAVPLVPAVMQLVEAVYLPYLSLLQSDMAAVAPAFAARLQRLADRQSCEDLPFLFFLEAEGDRLRWVEVSESSVLELGLLDWPLPLNLMRHRIASRLRALHVDAELIDGVLGHAEPGCETWGPLSMRSWQDDLDDLLPALAESYAQLGFSLPAVRRSVTLPQFGAEVEGSRKQRKHGHAARVQRRQQAQMRARKDAADQINEALRGRLLEDVDGKEIDALVIRMVSTPRGMPHPYAALRLSVLDDQMKAAWIKRRKIVRGKRVAVSGERKTSMSPDVVGAIHDTAALRLALDAASVRPSRLSQHELSALAALDLCLTSRVSSIDVLRAVAERKDTSLVYVGGQHWVEYRKDAERFPEQPALRFPLAERGARWLSESLARRPWATSTELSRSSVIPSQIADGLRKVLAFSTVDELLVGCGSRTARANALQLPGTLAAYLAREITSTSLPHADLARLTSGAARIASLSRATTPPDDVDVANDVMPRPVRRRPKVLATGKADRVAAGDEVLRALRDELNRYGAKNPRGADDTVARREVRSRIRKVANSVDSRAPAAALMLAAWTADLLERRPTRPHFLKPSSVLRYLSALSSRFLDLADDVDLAELDADDLTELYASIVADSDGSEQPDYVLQRLRDFHRFAQTQFHLESPDWSEVAHEGPEVIGAPGIVLEKEYLYALEVLVPDPAHADRDTLNAGALLLLTYRFGLRGREAFGLVRDDWVAVNGSVVVLVRSNASRALKRSSSQRQVPLLASLTQLESKLCEHWLATHQAYVVGSDRDALRQLFIRSTSGEMPSLRDLRHRVTAALRQATCAQHITPHHTRHSFANAVFVALFPHLSRQPLASWSADHVQRLLLGTKAPTRRALWAMARLLGHASPQTSLGSYVHVLAEAAASSITKVDGTSWRTSALLSACNLDCWAADPSYLQQRPPPSVWRPAPPTVRDLVHCAKLLAGGSTADAVASVLRIESGAVLRLKRAADRANGRSNSGNAFQRVLRKNWGRLMPLVEHVRVSENALPVEEARLLVGGTMQLLAWKRAHFTAIAGFLDAVALREEIVVYETPELHPAVAQWAVDAGLSKRFGVLNAAGTRRFQIDAAVDGEPENRVVHRCAIVRRASGRLRSNAELVSLFLCYCAATPA